MHSESIWKPFTSVFGRRFTGVADFPKRDMAPEKQLQKKNSKLSAKASKSDASSSSVSKDLPVFKSNFKIPRRKSNIENKQHLKSATSNSYTAQRNMSPVKNISSPMTFSAINVESPPKPLFCKGLNRVSHLLPNTGGLALTTNDFFKEMIEGTPMMSTTVQSAPIAKLKGGTSSSEQTNRYFETRKKKPMYNKIEENTRRFVRNLNNSAKQRAHMNSAVVSSNTTNSEDKFNSINSKQAAKKGKLETENKIKRIILQTHAFTCAIQTTTSETCNKKTNTSKRKDEITQNVKEKNMKTPKNSDLPKKSKLNCVSETLEQSNLKSSKRKGHKQFKTSNCSLNEGENSTVPEKTSEKKSKRNRCSVSQEDSCTVPDKSSETYEKNNLKSPQPKRHKKTKKSSFSVSQEENSTVPEKSSKKKFKSNRCCVSQEDSCTVPDKSSETYEQSNLSSPQPKDHKKIKRSSGSVNQEELCHEEELHHEEELYHEEEPRQPAEVQSISIVSEDNLRQSPEDLYVSDATSSTVSSVDQTNETFTQNRRTTDHAAEDIYSVMEYNSPVSLNNSVSELIEEGLSVVENNEKDLNTFPRTSLPVSSNERNCVSTREILEITLSDSDDDDDEIVCIGEVPAINNEVLKQLTDNVYNFLRQPSENKGRDIVAQFQKLEESKNRKSMYK